MDREISGVGIMTAKRKIRIWLPAAVGCVLALAVGRAYAIEPTHLEPADEGEAQAWSLEQTVEWEHHDDDTFESETEIEYGLNRQLTIGVSIPVEFGGGDGTELGNIGIFMEGIFNPDSTNGPLVGGELKLLLPTEEDTEGIGGEAQLRISQYFGAEDKHGLHLNVNGYYDTFEDEDDHWLHDLFDDDDSDDDFAFGGAVGYTYQISDATGLVLDVFYKDETDEAEHEALAEIGFKHEFNESLEGVLGVGIGLDNDSPDAIVKAGFEFRF